MLPNFLCIGAQKCGTTSISRWLEAQPSVFMPSPRETRFFVDDAVFERGVAYYEMEVFGGWQGQPVVGEKTPEYLLVPETPRRVRNYLGPDVRLVVCLRHPLKRAVSHYRHNLAARVESLPFMEALEQEDARIRGSLARTAYFGYRYRGQYVERLRPWLELFPRENFYFIELDALISPATGPAVLRGLANHIDLLEPRMIPVEASGHNVIPEWQIGEGEIVSGSTARSPSPRLRQFAEAAAALTPPKFTPQDFARLTETWWPDGWAELESITGLDLSGWSGG